MTQVEVQDMAQVEDVDEGVVEEHIVRLLLINSWSL